MTRTLLKTDYLIIGSGATGLAFADVIAAETDATILFVDRHHGPGGHWNDAYSFVRLHQPSSFYGVNSRPLGTGSHDATGLNSGMCERATAAELVAYYEAVMQSLLATGRVQYFPMCDYSGDFDRIHTFESRLSGDSFEVIVAKKVVDTTILKTAVPSTHPPKYAVAAGVRCIALNDLPKVRTAPSGYVVVGAGKTGVDACLWLLEAGISPDKIHWVMPRDSWFQNRACLQPGAKFFVETFSSIADQMEAVAQASDVADLFERLETTHQLLRMDPTVRPSMYHGAIMSVNELTALRRIKHIIRMGRIERIEPTQIVLRDGVVAADPGYLYVDCSASAVVLTPPVPVFAGNKITPQFVRTVQPTFSAALIAHIEASYEESAKEELCQVVPLPDQPSHWLAMLAANMRNQRRWSQDKALSAWIVKSRLDGFMAAARSVDPTDLEKVAILKRMGAGSAAAAANLPKLMATLNQAESDTLKNQTT